MVRHNYATKLENEEHFAKAVGRTLPISTKHSIELSRFLRKKDLQRAKDMLNQVIAKKLPVPFKRFTEIAHKKGKGIASAKFPEKAAKEFLSLLNSVEANAQFKGLNTAGLIIDHICAHKAGKQMHYGRRGREMKKTHVEIIVKEQAKKEKKEVKDNKKETKPEEKKKEVKPTQKEETKPEEKKAEKGKQEVKK